MVDVVAGRIVAANTAGWLLVAGRVPAERELALDRGTPALASLAALAAQGGSSQGQVLDLVFWTSAGVTSICARCEPARGAQPGRVVKLAVASQPAAASGPRPRRDLLTGGVPASSASTAGGPTKEASGDEAAGTTAGSDAETMSVIAQRIRAGLAERETERARAAAAAATPATGETDWKSADMARLAHELRTPLAAIVALAEVMRDERLGAMGNARYLGYAGDIMASAQHALEVLSASLERGPRAGADEELPRTECDVNAIVAACASQLRPLAEREGVRLATMLAAQMPRIELNDRALRQIIINLVSNALRHTPREGEITLVTGHRLESEARIEVRDTGSGMTPDEVEAALAGRPANARVPNPGGSMGLGLPLVKALAEANGARLTIDSRPGAGTRIALTFTLASKPAAG